MNKFDFALSLIRAPWAKRLTDRSFLLAIGAAAVGAFLYHQKSITGTEFANLLSWTIGPWIVANQAKDAIVANGALRAGDGAQSAENSLGHDDHDPMNDAYDSGGLTFDEQSAQWAQERATLAAENHEYVDVEWGGDFHARTRS